MKPLTIAVTIVVLLAVAFVIFVTVAACEGVMEGA